MPSPDYEAHSRATRASFPEIIRELRRLLGAKLCAYIGSVKETRAVNQWADGSREPSADVQRRLRIALQAATSIVTAESTAVAHAWFQGSNPQLDDRSPARLLRESDVDEVGPEIMTAARAFLSSEGCPVRHQPLRRASGALPDADASIPRGRLPYLDGTAIEAWASRRDAQHTLPRLVRRLVHATGIRLSTCSFRGGEGVQIPGWDGNCGCQRRHDVRTRGCLGVGTRYRPESEGEGRRRLHQPLGGSTRPCSRRNDVRVRHGEAVGREGRVGAAAPRRRQVAGRAGVRRRRPRSLARSRSSCGRWMSMELGYSPGSAIDLETFWREWADVTDPPIPPTLVTAGRENGSSNPSSSGSSATTPTSHSGRTLGKSRRCCSPPRSKSWTSWSAARSALERSSSVTQPAGASLPRHNRISSSSRSSAAKNALGRRGPATASQYRSATPIQCRETRPSPSASQLLGQRTS